MRHKKVYCELCGIREVRKPKKTAEHHFCHLCGTLNPIYRLSLKNSAKTFRPWYDEKGERVRCEG